MAGDLGTGARKGRGYDSGYQRMAHGGPSDEELTQAIRERLIRDERLDGRGLEIDIAVASGVATLGGEVGTLPAKRAAGDDAWEVGGVVDVRNLLRVGGQGQPGE